MARFNVFEVLKKVDASDVLTVLNLYNKYKPFVEKFLDKPSTPTVTSPNNPLLPTLPSSNKEQVYFSLKAELFFNERSGEVVPLPQIMKDRVHIDISPFDANGLEIRTGDPRHVIVPGDVPVRYRWWRDGKLNTAHEYSGLPQEEEDHFNLESVRDSDNGFTPVLRLETVEPGGHEVTFEAFIPAEFNGGVEVVSNRIAWTCD